MLVGFTVHNGNGMLNSVLDLGLAHPGPLLHIPISRRRSPINGMVDPFLRRWQILPGWADKSGTSFNRFAVQETSPLNFLFLELKWMLLEIGVMD